MSILRQQDLQKLSEEESRISSLISEKQELEEKLASMSTKASGTEISMAIPFEALHSCNFQEFVCLTSGNNFGSFWSILFVCVFFPTEISEKALEKTFSVVSGLFVGLFLIIKIANIFLVTALICHLQVSHSCFLLDSAQESSDVDYSSFSPSSYSITIVICRKRRTSLRNSCMTWLLRSRGWRIVDRRFWWK